MGERYLHAVYCDDVRNELGGKTSYMGIYNAEMLVPEFPFVLPKLCVAATLSTPPDKPIKHCKITISANETILAEIEQPFDSDESFKNKDAHSYKLLTYAVFTPLVLNEETALRVVADADGDTLRSGALKVRLLTEAERITAGLGPSPQKID